MNATVKIADKQNVNYDVEHYVQLHSSCFKNINGFSMAEVAQSGNTDALEGLVKISFNGRKAYRRYKGYNQDGDIIGLGYRTQCELGVKPGDSVTIEPACWFAFLWRNCESYIKYPFRLAVFGLIVTLLSFLIAIAGIVISVTA